MRQVLEAVDLHIFKLLLKYEIEEVQLERVRLESVLHVSVDPSYLEQKVLRLRFKHHEPTDLGQKACQEHLGSY